MGLTDAASAVRNLIRRTDIRGQTGHRRRAFDGSNAGAWSAGLEVLGVLAVVTGLATIISHVVRLVPLHALESDRFVWLTASRLLGNAQAILLCVAVALVIITIRRLSAGWSARDLGFRIRQGVLTDAWSGIAVFALLYVATLPLLVAALPRRAAVANPSNYEALLDGTVPGGLLVLTALLLVTGTLFLAGGEEVLFRGYVQGLLEREVAPGVGFLCAILLSVGGHVTTAADWTLLTVGNAVLWGAGYGVLFFVTGSLWPVVMTHALGRLVWDYPIALAMRGRIDMAYIVIFAIAGVALCLVLAGRHQLAGLGRRATRLFALLRRAPAAWGVGAGMLALAWLRAVAEIGQAFSPLTGGILTVGIGVACALPAMIVARRRNRVTPAREA